MVPALLVPFRAQGLRVVDEFGIGYPESPFKKQNSNSVPGPAEVEHEGEVMLAYPLILPLELQLVGGLIVGWDSIRARVESPLVKAKLEVGSMRNRDATL